MKTAIGAAIGVVGMAFTGCSLLLDWGQYTRAKDDEGGASPPPISCGAYSACAPLPQADAGWTGPVALYDAVSRPTCMHPVSFYEFAPAPATCTPCTCSTPGKADCQSPLVTYYRDSNCEMPCGHAPLAIGGACVSPPCDVADGGTGSFTITGSSFGPCAPSGGQASVDAGFVLRAQACAGAVSPATGVCPTGETCLATPPTPNAPRLCIMTTGDASSCPLDYGYGPEIYYTDPSQVNDTRGCSACSCGTPSGGCSFGFPGGVYRYTSECTIPIPLPVGVPLQCTTFSQATGGLQSVEPLMPNAGSCLPAGGTPIGSASPAGIATKVCCTTPADSSMP